MRLYRNTRKNRLVFTVITATVILTWNAHHPTVKHYSGSFLRTTNLVEIEDANSNITRVSCPECFRPKTAHTSGKMIEHLLQTSALPKQPSDYFTPKLNAFHNFPINYLIKPTVCNGQPPYLLAIQMSVISRSADRATVRNTWGSVARHRTWPNNRRVNAGVRVVFVVARQTPFTVVTDAAEAFRRDVASADQWDDIDEEAREFGDILYLDMIDSYMNLTLKVLSALRWTEKYCSRTRFILKVDADTFVNVPLLLDVLMYSEERLAFSILGYVYHRGSSYVSRAGQWSVNETVYPMDVYPEYASGGAYVLSYKVAAKIAATAPYVPMVKVEDAFITGIMRYVIKCQMFSLNGQMTYYLDRHWPNCAIFRDEKIVGTGADKNKMVALWEMFNNDGKECIG